MTAVITSPRPSAPAAEPQPSVQTSSEAELFCQLADYMAQPTHWIQGNFDNGRGGVCLLGGIGWITNKQCRQSWQPKMRNLLVTSMQQRLARVIRFHYPHYSEVEIEDGCAPDPDIIVDFNDDPPRKHSEIVNVLRLAGDCAVEV